MNQTLFVGIDVAKHTNYVVALNLNHDKLFSSIVPNTQDGANLIEEKLLNILKTHTLLKIIVVLEFTSVYSSHIATYLSASKFFSLFNIKVYIINPKISRNY